MGLSERARTFLKERLFGVLATLNGDGSIQQTNMWYLLEENDTILMNTTTERVKYHNMRIDSRISLCVQNGYQYVTIAGNVEVIDDPAIGQQNIFRLARSYEGVESALSQMRETFSKQPRVTLLLKPKRVIEYFSQ